MRKKRGQAPGTLVYTADHFDRSLKITLVKFCPDSFEEQELKEISEIGNYKEDSENIYWLDIDGFGDTVKIQEIGKFFEIDDLWLEDLLNTSQRPKVEEFESLLFSLMQRIHTYEKQKKILLEQTGLFLKDNLVISFQEHSGDQFSRVKKRLQLRNSRIRNRKQDYLYYALMDSIIDDYLEAVEGLGAEIEELENEIVENPSEHIPKKIIHLRNELMYLNRSAIPTKDVLNYLMRSEYSHLSKDTKLYLDDSYEHILQVVDLIENYRQMTVSLLDFHSSQVSLKMNEVMKTLTIFASIFIPLTFIVGVYGMNFNNMPELQSKNGYYYVWAVMIALTLGMVFYFKRKKWF